MRSIDEVEQAAKTIKHAKAALEYMEKHAWFKDREPDVTAFRIQIELPQGASEKGQYDFIDLIDTVRVDYKAQMINDATQLAFKQIREAAHVIGEFSKTLLDDSEVAE